MFHILNIFSKDVVTMYQSPKVNGPKNGPDVWLKHMAFETSEECSQWLNLFNKLLGNSAQVNLTQHLRLKNNNCVWIMYI